MSKHTPGPWVVDEANTNLVARLVDGVYEYVCAVEPSSFSTREYNNEQEEADARLIAAAPELLEALKIARPYVSAALTETGSVDAYRAECQVDIAIAKATGEPK